jgi:pimeloyl-ACP methyl ester carboxylesterase
MGRRFCSETAGWLTERAHVVAPDARGHGSSERLPEDVSREAHAGEDVGRGPGVP